MDEFASAAATSLVFSLIDGANTFIAEREPWKIANDPAREDELSQVLFDVAEAVRVAAILLLPVMPKSAGEILP